ncbi:MAG: acyl-CoA dehydrogenase family protein [Pseudomonadota bacterium]
MARNELLEQFVRVLDEHCPPDAVRAIQAGGDIAPMWDAFVASGFVDALVPEAADGAGLSLGEMAPLFQAMGRFAMPLPLAETMVARKLLAEAGTAWPDGPIAFVTGCAPVPCGLVATHLLIEAGDVLRLVPAAELTIQATGVHGSLAAWIEGAAKAESAVIAAPFGGLRPIAALCRASGIAGAAERLLEMTVAYANDRVQFGKPIGRLQAIQQQLSVMAEQVLIARFAAELGCRGNWPSPAGAAIAKTVSSGAAATIADIAHAVHGAIGISVEHDLQLYSRALRAGRLDEGGETYWAVRLGRERLAQAAGSSLDFVRGLEA